MDLETVFQREDYVDKAFLRRMKIKGDKLLGIREEMQTWKPMIVKKGDENPHLRDTTKDIPLPPLSYEGVKKSDPRWLSNRF